MVGPWQGWTDPSRSGSKSSVSGSASEALQLASRPAVCSCYTCVPSLVLVPGGHLAGMGRSQVGLQFTE